ncbi:MAG: T9SS type A sorting domain-containing protein [Flavobacteriaceae bacterium]
MKHFYPLIFFLFIALGYSQDTPRKSGDIAGFSLYPNPVTYGKVYISTQRNAPKKIMIFDVFGSPIMETTILGKELNLSELDAGVYVLRVFEANKVATRKLIVK